METIIEVDGIAELLKDEEWFLAGVIPCYVKEKMICKQCGEFSTRINIGCVCTDCLNKERAVS